MISLLKQEQQVHILIGQVADLMQKKQWQLCTAESCTGGLLAAACTEVAGASVWFDRGFVSYSNRAKTELLGVPEDLIAQHGAVSRAVAQAMAQGALTRSAANMAVSVTGVAGPSGGSAEKPVGTVCFGWASRAAVRTEQQFFAGDRAQVRSAAVAYALAGVLRMEG